MTAFRFFTTAALFGAALLAAPSVQAQDGDAARGRTLFQRQCQACHQVAQPRNGVGPTLQGVMGRAAGGVEGYNYSPALRALNQTWTPETMDAYLANPTGVARGTRMVLRVAAEQDRKDIIAFVAAP
ncbi:cytochrome c family protein [Pseudoroseomonas wenyumeiae]|uniref:Cytochrome c family protein n=1 Tax=Teichococcus wenyumeiae TaxID=2478470 RepID=A0A3A9JWT2_9PROT|nr:c-type cytochrome [Pseudoroseomonas wenyumeiae]RKK03509.1 cytochrome c family protein [Pseudoroseomonas wenyumeiae]RMI17004.1 cytochrome c family protein [Pseudoroseomonas wenyumeiae]